MGRLSWFLRRYATRHLWTYAGGFAALFATNWIVVRIPTLIGEALNALSADAGPSGRALARAHATELAAWALLVVLVRTASRAWFFNPGRDVEFALRNDLFRHLLTWPRALLVRRKTGDLVSLATNDVTSVRVLVGFAGLQLCNTAVAIPLHLWGMARTDVGLTLMCLVPVGLGAAWMRLTISRFYGLIRQSAELLGSLSDRILESMTGLPTLRSNSAEAAAVRRFDVRNDRYLALLLSISRTRAFAMPLLGVSGLVSSAIVLWVGGAKVVQGTLQVGDLATFTGLLISLVSVLAGLAWVMAAVSRGLVSLDRVDEVLSQGGADVLAGVPLPEGPLAIELEHVSVRHAGAAADALHDLSLSIAAGERVGVFGLTGAGKSTFVDVLSRVVVPTGGCVTFGGVDLSQASLASVRGATATVPQTAFLFSASVAHNVRLAGTEGADEDAGRAGASGAHARRDDAAIRAADARLSRVLSSAALDEDLRRLPDGLSTRVGERGVMLSGGQRQRVALARALYREARVLLLDDVLSAVDQGTEARLVAALQRLRGPDGDGPTTVVVSHRTSVFEHVDRVVVLEDGRITDVGTHAQLLQRPGLYARVHAEQTREAQAHAHSDASAEVRA